MLKYEKPLLLDLEEVAAAAVVCDTGGSVETTEVEIAH